MEKLYAIACALLLGAFAASADEPLYSVIAKGHEMPADWGDTFDVAMLPDDVRVDVYADHLYLHSWMGIEGRDLALGYVNATAGVPWMREYVNGKPGQLCENGSCGIYTGLDDWYYADLMFDEGYAFASADMKMGYVIISSVWYTREFDIQLRYFSIEWNRLSEGVGDAVCNDAPEAYYTIQGVKVDRPASGGVYIVRRGADVRKVAF